MPLSPERIKELMAIKAKPKRGRGGGKTSVDTSDRTYQTWFKLHHKMLDDETGELAKCENPNCLDTRDKGMVVVINGRKMCRRCFMDGWLTENPDQTVLVEE